MMNWCRILEFEFEGEFFETIVTKVETDCCQRFWAYMFRFLLASGFKDWILMTEIFNLFSKTESILQ